MRNAITTFSIFEKVNLDLKSLKLRAICATRSAKSEALKDFLKDTASHKLRVRGGLGGFPAEAKPQIVVFDIEVYPFRDDWQRYRVAQRLRQEAKG